MNKLSDERLVEKAKQGDSHAFAALVERYYLSIYRFSFKWCGNQADAEDTTQDVCIKLGRSINGFDGRAEFSSWVFRITLNTVRDLARKQERRKRKLNNFAQTIENIYTPDPTRELTRQQLWQKVLDLPDKQRDVIMLVYSEGLNHRRAAEILGCSEKTVSWHVHEAKKALKLKIGS